MTEKEKMIMGELYLAFGEELTNERQHARKFYMSITCLSQMK